jgi:hypothetical protein
MAIGNILKKLSPIGLLGDKVKYFSLPFVFTGLMKKSTEGSPTFTEKEIKQDYRRK